MPSVINTTNTRLPNDDSCRQCTSADAAPRVAANATITPISAITSDAGCGAGWQLFPAQDGDERMAMSAARMSTQAVQRKPEYQDSQARTVDPFPLWRHS